MDYNKASIEWHEKLRGKIDIHCKIVPQTREDLSTYYSPGVAEPCRQIAVDPEKAYNYTWKGNTIAVISDGSAVLGLGNIGALAGLPVMEWKAMLFKTFGWVNAVPIVLQNQDPEHIISVVESLAPTFGGINLEDIKAPQCFYIEEELKKRLNIPVFHDDQHGTAIVVLAALINSLKLAGKAKDAVKVVMSGAGAAAIAIAKLLITRGVKHIILVDSKWALYQWRADSNPYKDAIIPYNITNAQWGLKDVIVWADVFIGVSQPNVLDRNDIQKMTDKPIIFAMANPIPEILPEEAQAGGAYIMATGRSDYPNQVNNVLVFPGLFKWALEGRIKQFTDEHFLAAAYALAESVNNPTPDNIIPSALEQGIADMIANAVKKVG